MENITAKVSCFARAYHTRNNTTHIFADTAVGLLLGEDYDRIAQSVAVLMQSEEGKAALKALLQSPNGYVRTWTAMVLTAEEPRVCKKILKEAAKETGVWAGTVRTFLEEWKKGNLDSAFS